MAALVRTELLLELLSRVTAELLVALGWRGTAVLVLVTLVSHGLGRGTGGTAGTATRPRKDGDPASGTAGTTLACVATVLLAVLLLADQ